MSQTKNDKLVRYWQILNLQFLIDSGHVTDAHEAMLIIQDCEYEPISDAACLVTSADVSLLFRIDGSGRITAYETGDL